MKMGAPSYGGNNVKRTYKSIKDGNNVYRILPPMGTLADTGKWFVYWAIHFGYVGKDGKMHPFPCVQKKDRNKMITTRCPACDAFEDAKLELENQKAQGVTKETLELLAKRVRELQVDKKYYVNALSAEGLPVILKIPHRAKKSMDLQNSRLREDGIDPIAADQGVWFNFFRQGFGGDTVHNVDVVLDRYEVNGRMVRDIKRAPLTQEQVDYLTGANTPVAELDQLYRTLSVDEVGMIANGDADTVDRVFSQQDSTAQAPNVAAPTAQAPAAQAPTIQQPITPVQTPIATTSVAPPVQAPVVATPVAPQPTVAAPAAPQAPVMPTVAALAPAAPPVAAAPVAPVMPTATQPVAPTAPVAAAPIPVAPGNGAVEPTPPVAPAGTPAPTTNEVASMSDSQLMNLFQTGQKNG